MQPGCQHCRWLGTQLALAAVSGSFGPRLTLMERLIAAERAVHAARGAMAEMVVLAEQVGDSEVARVGRAAFAAPIAAAEESGND